MTPARGERRRASRGNTHDPYECCGADAGPYGRRKGTICDACKQLIQDGKALRDQVARAKGDGALAVFTFHERDYAMVGYYGLGVPDVDRDGKRRDMQRELQAAMFALVHAVATPAPATTPSSQPSKPSDYKPWPNVLSESQRDCDWRTLVLLPPATRAAIDALDQAIRETLAATYLAGKAKGRSVLQGLASGDVSVADFDDALLTSEERAERARARRHY